MRSFFLLLLLALTCRAEPLLRPNDVVALIGGEEMVVINEEGRLEMALHAHLPPYHLKIRSLAWEGDTVFEQRRDLNYPRLEAQLDEIGATVVVAQFGRMELLDGARTPEDFAAAYAKLIERLGGTKRRWLLLAPTFVDSGAPVNAKEQARRYQQAIEGLSVLKAIPGESHEQTLREAVRRLVGSAPPPEFWTAQAAPQAQTSLSLSELHALIREKNRLWFHYTRPQNWAFLAGDRTNQPSSRDHMDKNKRWFPEEMAQYLPLIAAKEQAIWARAEKTAQ